VTLLYDVCLDVVCESAGRPTHPMAAAARQTMSGGESHGKSDPCAGVAGNRGFVGGFAHTDRLSMRNSAG
jgi:hypothetical protein